jgi:manganese oxidase
MEEKMSRRRMSGLSAATIGGVTAITAGARAGTGEHPEHPQAAAGAPHGAPERPYWEASSSGGPVDVKPLSPGRPGKEYRPVVVPTGYTLPWKAVGGVKVFHVIAEEVDHAFDVGLWAKCWAYNGHVNSTVIEAVEGERVRIYVTNRLNVATSVHWHGIYLPNGMDGVGGPDAALH